MVDTTYSAEVNQLRTPPHNIELEQCLLGALLMDASCYERISLAPEHFFDPLHGDIFKNISQLITKNRAVHPSALATYYIDAEPINEGLPVADYLWRLVDCVTSVANVPDYATTIKDLAQRRELIRLAEHMMAEAYVSDVNYPPTRLIEEIESELFSLVERREGDRDCMLNEAVAAALEQINEAYKSGGKIKGVSSGIKAVDNVIGGLQDSDFVVLAGRPSMGKTALAINIAENVARAGHFVDVYSLEMSSEQLAERMIATNVGVPGYKMRRGNMSSYEAEHVQRKGPSVGELPIHIDTTGGLTLAQLTSRARRIKRKHQTALIVIDYLQLMQPGRKSQNRVQDITEITVGLKALAKELDVPVLALSQLSRATEQRTDKRPQLSDLRESGSIEQDADQVLFVYRDEYYLDREEPPEDDIDKRLSWQEKKDKAAGRADLIVAKNRHGRTGVITLNFDGERTRFSEGGAA